MDVGKGLGVIASAGVRHLVFHTHSISGVHEVIYNAVDMFVSEFARRHLEEKLKGYGKTYINLPEGNLAAVLISRSIGILAGVLVTVPFGKIDYVVLVAANAASLFACVLVDAIEHPFVQAVNALDSSLAPSSQESVNATPALANWKENAKVLIDRYLAGRVMYT